MPSSGPTVQNVALLQVFRESTFGTDATGSLGSFLNVPWVESAGATFSLMQDTKDPGFGVQYHHDYREEILGKKSCSIQFTLPLASTGVAANSGTTQVQGTLGYILETVLGIEAPATLAAGSAAAGAWAGPATGDVTTSHGSRFAKGSAIGWVNASSVYEMRPVKTISTDTITTKLAFSGTPASSDAIYNCASYMPSSDPDGSLQFVVRGLESQDEFVLMGCQLDSMTMTLPIDGEIPTIQFSFKGCSWLRGADAAGSASLTDITPLTYSNVSPITGQAGRFMHQVVGTTTYTGSTVNVNAVAFEPQHAFQPITSPSGVEGVLRWRLSRQNGPSIQGSFNTYFEDTSWWTHKESQDDLLLLYQVGTVAGKSLLLEVSTAQITDVQRVDGSGIADVQITYKGRRDTDGSPSGDQQYAPWRLHLG